jgi:ATP-dependent exoDNAse (exonuclease V) beta subunit
VAFTRPTERLYVITEKVGKSKSTSENISKLIQFFLNHAGVFEEEKTEYAFGDQVPKKMITEESSNQMVELRDFISENWRQKLLISTNAPDVWDIKNPEKNKEWGNLIHLMLSKIQYKEDTEKVVSQFIESGIIRPADMSEVLKAIDKLMNHEQAGQFFESGLEVKNEAEILMTDGHVLRPDRLIFGKDNLSIIDYKTGKPEIKHEQQINGYAKNLAQMGYKNIQKYLIYINEDIQVQEVL